MRREKALPTITIAAGLICAASSLGAAESLKQQKIGYGRSPLRIGATPCGEWLRVLADSGREFSFPAVSVAHVLYLADALQNKINAVLAAVNMANHDLRELGVPQRT